MSEDVGIADELLASGIKLIGDLVQDASDRTKWYAFVQVERDKGRRQSPSNYKLRKIAESLEKRSLQVAFVLVENEQEDLQASIKTMLFRFFPGIVRNAFASFDRKGATIWVEPKKILTREEEEAVAAKTKEFLQFLKVRFDAVRITSSENVPTRTACLNTIRLNSPVKLKEIRAALNKRGFHVPSDDWLSHMLDKLRKDGLVFRRKGKDGQFMLTLSGLEALGTAKNARSPDVLRALDIAKRGA